MQRDSQPQTAIPFWRDERILKVLGPIAFVVLIVLAVNHHIHTFDHQHPDFSIDEST